MLALAIAILATVLLTPFSNAQEDSYTVLSSVVFVRSGERTPQILSNVPPTLTSLGARQAYAAGSYFRNRYVSSTSSDPGFDKAPLRGLSPNSVDPRQLYVLAWDSHPTVATAQAFIQGFYPPYVLNQSIAGQLDPTSVLANETYIENPLDGYQYAQIRTVSDLDPEFIYLAGSLRCPAFRGATIDYTNSQEFEDIQTSTKSFYESLGGGILDRILPDISQGYLNAYAIYDYVNYHANHNATVAAAVDERPTGDGGSNFTELDRLRFLADAQQFAWLGNMSARNNITTPSTGLPGSDDGSISTIAGNLLLAKVLNQLQTTIETRGRVSKLSVLVGDFQPLMSLFALTGLSDLNTRKFRGIPEFASTAVFELFTHSNSSLFPVSSDDLWVRFYFRNGTGEQEDQLDIQSYPLFSHGPSETDLNWRDFQAEAASLAMSNVGDWCEACGSQSVFCPAFNATLFSAAEAAAEGGSSTTKPLSAGVAAVLGAVVALIVAAVLFAIAILCVGVRFHRKKTLQAGGFRGPAKMTPDRDVEVNAVGAATKTPTVVGAREAPAEGEVGGSVVGGHERVGSWEMKPAGDQAFGGVNRSRASFEDDGDEDYRRAVDPFADPVKPNERV